MEVTLYDDAMYRPPKSSCGDARSLKRPVTLNLDSPDSAAKKQRFAAILTSPDLQMLKLASPELERFIITNGKNIAATPTPTQILFPKNVTEEQEQYARGFIDALNHLHQTQFEMNASSILSRISTGLTPLQANPPESSSADAIKQFSSMAPFYLQPSTTSVIRSTVAKPKPAVSLVVRPSTADTNSNSSDNSLSSTSLEIAVKEEFQTVPSDFSTPPLSPICPKGPVDMEEQEKIKLERKRYRNRVAASKCRKRKLEKISQLEEKVAELKGENGRLELVADQLREEVTHLKSEVLEHVRKGCQIMLTKKLC